jgi:Leucine-rich repeat (LRR) protein
VDVDEGLRALASGPAGESIQILYMNECSLTVLPKEINNMKKLGLLSVASNKISEIEAAYPDISFVQLYLDNNQITEFPHYVSENGKKLFFRIEDVETFSCTYNKVKKFPNIFDADAVYGIASIDFSYNDIDGFEGEEDGTYQGIYVQTLSMANNPRLGKYPKCIADTKSKVDYIILRGCGIDEIPEGSFTGENSKYLMSLDLSYNHLDDLPREIHAANMPYFYGIDLSYNRFSSFPFEPFDCASLTMMAIRGQRDEKGERCLSEWPQGVYNHTGLRALYMGSNNLGKIDDRISYLIYYLDISDNPNIVFDASEICSQWMNGVYFLLYDKTQDIRGCEPMLY